MAVKSPFCLHSTLPLKCIGSRWNPVMVKPKDPLYPLGYHLSGLIQGIRSYLKTTKVCQARHLLLAPIYYLVLRYNHTCSWGRMLRSRCHPGVRWRCRRHQLSLTKSLRRQPLLTSMVLCLTPLALALISHFLHYWGHLPSVKPRHLLLIIISRKKVSTLPRSPKERGGKKDSHFWCPSPCTTIHTGKYTLCTEEA